MYTLRTRHGNTATENQNLGNHYSVFNPVSDYFHDQTKEMKEDDKKMISGFLVDEKGITYPLHVGYDYYIMTENGKTFEKL